MQLLPASVKQKIEDWIVSRIPLARRTIFKPLLLEQSFVSANIDVATVHAILDGTDLGQTNEYFALCDLILLSDSHMQGEIAKRKLALLGDEWAIAPVDKKNAADKAAADAIKEMIDGLPSFLSACGWLLDGTIWPLALVEKVFRRATKNGKLNYEVDRLIQVPPRLFDYTETGMLRVWDTDPNTGSILSTRHDPDPMRYITHRGHLLSLPDYRGGPMRALVFWWLFSNFDRDWWGRFLDRYGSPFLLGKYDQADDDSRIILENAFSLASRLGGIAVSRQTDVEIKEAMSKSGGEGFELFLKTCNREKSKLIVGQTSSADAEHGGLGSSGMATAQAQVRDDIRQFDSVWLGNTLKYQLFDPFLRMNGIAGNARIVWGGEQATNIEQIAQAISSLSTAGIEVTDEGLDSLSAQIGLPLQRKEIVDVPPVGAPPGRGPRLKALTVDLPRHYLEAEDANDAIARGGSAELSRAFSGLFAPIRRFILDSSSAEDLIAKIDVHYPGMRPELRADLLLQALAAYAANGAVRDAA